MIYLDNAATTFPKPTSVTEAVSRSCAAFGNPGRGGHRLSLRAAEEVYACRSAVGEMFGASLSRVVFTSGATNSLNMAIGAHLDRNGAILISDLEHNAVRRPAIASKKQVRIFTSAVNEPLEVRTKLILDSIDRQAKGTSMLVCTAASNICGARMPIAEIGRYCRQHGILFIVDGAQAGGTVPLHMERDCIDILCLPAHKGLYGIMGCGVMILAPSVTLPPLIHGGSGVDSKSLTMPDTVPERYEAGTLPLPAIAGLRAGVTEVKRRTPEAIAKHEARLASMLKRRLTKMGAAVYASHHDGSIVLFDVPGIPSEEISQRLDAAGICTRAGLHCAPLAHDAIGTNGAVRVSFGMYNSDSDVKRLCEVLGRI